MNHGEARSLTAPLVLLSGFRPFDVFTANSSYEMLRPLDGRIICKMTVATLELPVEFGNGARVLLERAEALRPAIVMSFGLADGPNVRLETAARNLIEARIPDGAGCQPKGDKVVPGAPGSYPNGLPLESIGEALLKGGYPVERSASAGGFVCNDLFFRLMHWRATDGPDIPCGFIHVPPLEGAGGDHGWKRERLEGAARVMVEGCIRAIAGAR
jgi:pyroglutamyl-peptidase